MTTDSANAGQQARIIIVDPNKGDQNFLQIVLSFQFQVASVGTGEAAAYQMAEREFQLALVNSVLPGMSGLELLKTCREQHPGTAVILVADAAKLADAVNFIKAGAVDYLSKPFAVDHLLEKINAALTSQKAKQNPTSPSASSDRFGYKKIRTIGVGNIGKVELVEKDGVQYAMKIFREDRCQAQFHAQIERFIREAEILSGIDHPCIVKIFEFNHKIPPYIVMEYVEGKPLTYHIAKNSLDFSKKLDIITDIAFALDTVHHLGILHRDIKPENVLVTDDLRIKLTDFGIARIAESNLTITGEIFGSPAYMAPEAFTSMKDIDQRADIFSLGVLSYELLTGEKPFKGDNILDIMESIQDTSPTAPTEIQPDLPVMVQDILAKMLT